MDKIYGVYHGFDHPDSIGDYEEINTHLDLLFVSDDYDFCNQYVKEHNHCYPYGRFEQAKYYEAPMFKDFVFMKELPTCSDLSKKPIDILGEEYLKNVFCSPYYGYCDNSIDLDEDDYPPEIYMDLLKKQSWFNCNIRSLPDEKTQ